VAEARRAPHLAPEAFKNHAWKHIVDRRSKHAQRSKQAEYAAAFGSQNLARQYSATLLLPMVLPKLLRMLLCMLLRNAICWCACCLTCYCAAPHTAKAGCKRILCASCVGADAQACNKNKFRIPQIIFKASTAI
jgi:hypothetical protein